MLVVPYVWRCVDRGRRERGFLVEDGLIPSFFSFQPRHDHVQEVHGSLKARVYPLRITGINGGVGLGHVAKQPLVCRKTETKDAQRRQSRAKRQTRPVLVGGKTDQS